MSLAPSVLKMAAAIREQAYAPDLDPSSARTLLRQLSILNVTIGVGVASAERLAFSLKQATLSADPKCSDAKAETTMRASEEWERYRSLRAIYESNQEVMNALKYDIRKASDEMGDTRYQD